MTKLLTYFCVTLLGLVFSFGSPIAATGIVTEKPPALGDVYFMAQYKDGSSQLFLNLSDHEYKKLVKDNSVNNVVKASYADIVASVTQRVYDYHFYLAQFIGTDSTADPAGWNAALDRLMTVFSDKLTLFEVLTPTHIEVNSKAAVRETYKGFYEGYFRGLTLHTAPNVRVIPVCEDNTFQVYVSSGLIDYSRVQFQDITYVTEIGYYNFKLAYEPDNVWRFVTWQDTNTINYVIPPLNFQPVPYTPYLEDPVTNCCSSGAAANAKKPAFSPKATPPAKTTKKPFIR